MKEKLNLTDEQFEAIVERVKSVSRDFKEVIVRELKNAMVQIGNELIDILTERLGISKKWLNAELN